MSPDLRARLLRAWLLTAVVDGLFASVLVTLFYGSTFARLWQGVASTLLGPSAMRGGARTVLVGILMHFGVALGWSLVFVAVWAGSASVRRLTSTWPGIVAVAAVYGPLIWLFMSLVVIRTLRDQPPTFDFRWWVQLLAHVPFVAVPIVAGVALGRAHAVAPDPAVAPATAR